LAHLVRRLELQRDPYDRPDGTEADDDTREVGICARHGQEVTVSGDDLELGNRGREVPVAVAGAVGRRGDRARHRDVRQRRQVREREAAATEDSGELPVAGCAAERRRA
jgi:hypothetical protein